VAGSRLLAGDARHALASRKLAASEPHHGALKSLTPPLDFSTQ
jgi:hypothetical protein